MATREARRGCAHRRGPKSRCTAGRRDRSPALGAGWPPLIHGLGLLLFRLDPCRWSSCEACRSTRESIARKQRAERAAVHTSGLPRRAEPARFTPKSAMISSYVRLRPGTTRNDSSCSSSVLSVSSICTASVPLFSRVRRLPSNICACAFFLPKGQGVGADRVAPRNCAVL